jgi:glycerol uptake facilitator protein
MNPKNTLFLECVTEFIGIFFLIFIGTGCVAALVFLKNYSSFWELSCVWGFAVTCAIAISGGVSGAHLNPAVTIAFAVTRGFPTKKIIPYIVAQVAGAFCGAALCYALYSSNFTDWETVNAVMRGSAETKATASIFTTFPQPWLSPLKACLVETSITALFMMLIMAVSDPKNPTPFAPGISPLFIGLGVTIIGGSFGALTGFALNPARDLGPRIFLYLAGWGDVVFPGPGGYFWVPIVGPILGALIGAVLYQIFIHTALLRQAEKA